MSPNARGQRIQASCITIWGAGDYEVDVKTDGYEHYQGHMKQDFGTHCGPPLTMTGLCQGSEEAWAELDRMLGAWARVCQRRQQTGEGQPMTKEETLEIFGGPGGKNKALLERVWREMAIRKGAGDRGSEGMRSGDGDVDGDEGGVGGEK